MKISSDNRLNSQLQKDVSDLRDCIVNAVQSSSERFIAAQSADTPEMIITDTITWRRTTVPLYAYNEVMKTLTELFEQQ